MSVGGSTTRECQEEVAIGNSAHIGAHSAPVADSPPPAAIALGPVPDTGASPSSSMHIIFSTLQRSVGQDPSSQNRKHGSEDPTWLQ